MFRLLLSLSGVDTIMIMIISSADRDATNTVAARSIKSPASIIHRVFTLVSLHSLATI